MKTTILATVGSIIACSSHLVAADDHKNFKVLVTPKLKYHDASKYCKIQGYSLIDVTSENFYPLSKFVSKKLGKDSVWIRSWNGDDYEQKYGETPLALTPMSKFGKGSINVRKDYGLKLRGICQLYPRVSYGYESRSISEKTYVYDDKTGVYKVPTYGYEEKKDYGYGDKKENYGSGDKKGYGYENKKKEHDYEVEKPHHGYEEPSYGYDHEKKEYGVRDLKVDNKDYEKKDYEKKDYEKKDYEKKDYGKDEKDYGKDEKDYGKDKKDYGKDKKDYGMEKKDYGKDDTKPEDGHVQPYPMPTWE
ncbi:hypothetical protein MP228_012101 [Amoeboaphelidium protococcarum]|nr:hypothetical protein MP228_012101 [Amoeboaphelidium protococcarum]